MRQLPLAPILCNDKTINLMKTRRTLRWIHIIGALLIGTYIYSPFSNLLWFQLLMQIGIMPALALTGLWMWKPAWFKRKGKTQ